MRNRHLNMNAHRQSGTERRSIENRFDKCILWLKSDPGKQLDKRRMHSSQCKQTKAKAKTNKGKKEKSTENNVKEVAEIGEWQSFRE